MILHMNICRFRAPLLSLVSALLFSLAMPNEILHYGSPALMLFSLAPFFLSMRMTKSRKTALANGLFFSGLFAVLQFFWLLYFQDFSLWTLCGLVLGHLVFFFFLSPMLYSASGYSSPLRPFLLAALWLSYEYLRSLGYIGFPWNLSAHPIGAIAPIAQTASLAGMWPISFWAVLCSAVLAETVASWHQRSDHRIRMEIERSWVFLLLFTAVLILSGYALLSTERVRIDKQKSMKLLLIQTNADFWRPGEALKSMKQGQELSRRGLAEHPESELVIWSENSLQYPYVPDESYYRLRPENDPFVPFLREIDRPLLTGSPYFIRESRYQAMNSVFTIRPDGSRGSIYGKRHLVPFAEHVPFWEFRPFRHFLEQAVGLRSAGWTPGSSFAPIPLLRKDGSTVEAGTPICFEDCFPYIAREQAEMGAELFINLTNDSWSKTVTGETQHFAAARYRAIETGRSLVRSTNAGVSCLIRSDGQVEQSLPLYRPAYLYLEAPLSDPTHTTAYMLLGDWFPQLLLLLLLMGRSWLLLKTDRPL